MERRESVREKDCERLTSGVYREQRLSLPLWGWRWCLRAPLLSGNVLQWRFEGNTHDPSGNGRNGSPTNILFSGDAASFNSSSPTDIPHFDSED